MITTEIRQGLVDSTMDTAKAVAGTQDFLLVSAEGQTRGKGTRGRAWQSPKGNIYMTLGINRRHLPSARLALLPLEIGTLLWEEAAGRIAPQHRGVLSLKWPNDLLLDGVKAAGILMEAHAEFLLIGLGINVAVAPPVSDGGNPSACLADFGMDPKDTDALVEGLYRRVIAAFYSESADPSGLNEFDPEGVLLAWQGKVDWNRTHRLRDREGRPAVTPISINKHGHLLVRHADGAREWLVSEYLA